MRPLRLAALWQAGGWFLVGLVIWGGLAPIPAGAVLVDDKLLHVLTYMVLALWFGGLYERRRLPWVALALSALGVAVEIAQGTLVARTMDGADVLANTAGVLAGLALALGPPGNWCSILDRSLTSRRHRDG